MRLYLFWAGAILVFGIICFFHIWQMPEIPRGLYVDEVSIGYNAFLIATTGRDEHQHAWPVYFEAFGEYKNPLFIYALAMYYRLFGISEFGARFTSFCFFLTLLLAILYLARKVFPSYPILCIYAMLAVGFLPWFFTLSRIAFEVIAQPAMVALTLCFAFNTFHLEDSRHKLMHAALTGIFLGLSLYSYSTARLLTFVLFMLLLAIYWRRATLKESATISGAFAVCLIPYFIFGWQAPGALTARFRDVSYLYSASITKLQAAVIFVREYAANWSPSFLLFKGDGNLRHATGHGGEVFLSIFLLFLVALAGLTLRRQWSKDRFALLLLINLALAPVAAALTTGGPHALRSVLVGMYILLLSCYGFAFILSLRAGLWKRILVVSFLVLLMVESAAYLRHFFTEYRDLSVAWFESYDFKKTLAFAIGRRPKEIVVSNFANQPYILVNFYRELVDNPDRIPIRVDAVKPEKGTCIIYFRWNQNWLNIFDEPYRDLSPKDSFVKLRCYY